jgi:hypothetical protein
VHWHLLTSLSCEVTSTGLQNQQVSLMWLKYWSLMLLKKPKAFGLLNINQKVLHRSCQSLSKRREFGAIHHCLKMKPVQVIYFTSLFLVQIRVCTSVVWLKQLAVCSDQCCLVVVIILAKNYPCSITTIIGLRHYLPLRNK